jgi:hypothetical protein
MSPVTIRMACSIEVSSAACCCVMPEGPNPAWFSAVLHPAEQKLLYAHYRGDSGHVDAARVCSPQQITEAFFDVGGQYRRNT